MTLKTQNVLLHTYCINMFWKIHQNEKRKGRCENVETDIILYQTMGVQWLSGRVLDSRLRDCGFELHQRHCIVSLSKTLYTLQPRKTWPDMTEKLLTGIKDQTQQNHLVAKWHHPNLPAESQGSPVHSTSHYNLSL